MICISCNVEKPIDAFEKRADTKKLRSQCKECRNEYVKRYKSDRQSGKIQKCEHIVVDNKQCCRICSKWKDLSDFKTRKTSHGYRTECKDCNRDQLRKYYEDVYNEVRRNKKKTDIQYKIMCNHRTYIYKCLTRFGNKKNSSISYIGCSIDTLKEWLAFQFHNGMSWENYGKYWTIDHVLPLSLFDMTNDRHIKIAFNWKNLQPSLDNFVKSNNLRQYEFFNIIISAHRFIQLKKMKSDEYQTINESLSWLREELRYGKNLKDDVVTTTEMGNPQPSS
jgi:hypothetical protein